MDERMEKKRQRQARQREKARQLRLDDFVRAALEHQAGREYLWWVMEISGIGRNPHTANALNTAFQCGEMNVGQKVQAHIMQVAPRHYLNMLEEKEEERVNAERQSNDELDNDPAAADTADGSDDQNRQPPAVS